MEENQDVESYVFEKQEPQKAVFPKEATKFQN